MRALRPAIAGALAALLSSGALAAAPATATPTVSDVAHRWLAATGGEKAWRKLAGSSLRGTSNEAGVEGSVEAWIGRDGSRLVTTQKGSRREEVCLGAQAWLLDWNGKVRPYQGRDLADVRAAALIHALLYAGAAADLPSSGATVTADPAAPGQVVVKLAPQGTAAIDVVIDQATHLPSKFVRKAYDDTIVVTPSDWRMVKGVKVPFKLAEGGGEEGTADAVVVSDVAPAVKAPEPKLGRPADGPSDVAFASGRSALGIPFNFENDHLMVDASVNGRPALWFMLDTGAEATYVNTPRMAELGLEPFGARTVSGGGNSADSSFTKVDRLEVGGVVLKGQRASVLDMTGLEKIYGRKMGGILGYDFFSRFVVRVDYGTKTIDLLDPDTFTAPASAKPVPFVLEEGHPHVAATIAVPTAPSIPADMVVDSGAADTANLCAPFVKTNKLLELARNKPPGAPNTMAGSEKEFFAQTSVRGRLSGLTLGPFTVKDIPNNLMVGTTGAYASTAFSGTIGQGVLKRFTTIYDYSRSVILLEPNADFDKPFPPRKTFGATFLSEGADYDAFRITGIRKGSPAEAAGLHKDDLIAEIDGKPASTFHLADIRQTFTTEGAHHALKVKRGEADMDFDIVVTLVSIEEP